METFYSPLQKSKWKILSRMDERNNEKKFKIRECMGVRLILSCFSGRAGARTRNRRISEPEPGGEENQKLLQAVVLMLVYAAPWNRFVRAGYSEWWRGRRLKTRPTHRARTRWSFFAFLYFSQIFGWFEFFFSGFRIELGSNIVRPRFSVIRPAMIVSSALIVCERMRGEKLVGVKNHLALETKRRVTEMRRTTRWRTIATIVFDEKLVSF